MAWKNKTRKQKIVQDSEGNLCISAAAYLRQTYNCGPQRASFLAEQMAAQGIAHHDDCIRKFRYLFKVGDEREIEQIEEFMETYGRIPKGVQKGIPKPKKTCDSLHDLAERKSDLDWVAKINRGKIGKKPKPVTLPSPITTLRFSGIQSEPPESSSEVYPIWRIREEIRTTTSNELNIGGFLKYLAGDQCLLREEVDENSRYLFYRDGISKLGRFVWGKDADGERVVGYEKEGAIRFIDFVKEDFGRRRRED